MSSVSLYLQSIISNWYEDYLELSLITSRTRGKLRSIQRPFGVGKSTLAFHISYMLHYVAHYGVEGLADMTFEDGRLWDEVFNHAVYASLDAVVEMITYVEERIPCVVWDDAQLGAPAITNIPKAMKEKINYLSTTRDAVANIILTAPNISELAKPLRKFISYELIVPERGRYEVQKITRRKNFYAPTKDYERLIYLGEGTFPPFTPELEERYKAWRRKHRRMLGMKILIADKVSLRPRENLPGREIY